MVGSGDGAGQLSVPVCPTNLDNSRLGPIVLAVGEGEVVSIFLLAYHFFFSFSLFLSWRQTDRD